MSQNEKNKKEVLKKYLPSQGFKRVVIKLSGEILAGEKRYGIDVNTIRFLSKQIFAIHNMGIEIAIVIGGGNIMRGSDVADDGIHRVTADHMGMMATIINGLALQDILEDEGMVTRLQTAIEIKSVAEPFIRRKAIRHLEKKRIVILAGGTGNPYFTTDTTSVLRAVELNADAVLKATKVDGVYDKDPNKHKEAKRFAYLSFNEAINQQLKIMDSTAFTLCRDNKLPIFVFHVEKENELYKLINGESVGTIIGLEEGAYYHGES